MLPFNDLPEFGEDFSVLRDSYLADEALVVSAIFAQASLNHHQKERVHTLAHGLISDARQGHHPLFDEFLQSYRLNSQEGHILLTLAEALLRIPDAHTRNELINNLLPQANWHLPKQQQSKSIQWASKALTQARRFIEAETFPDIWHQLLLKMGDSVLRPALSTGIQLLAKQFVLAETLPEALALKKEPFLYSFDCLGEAAQTWHEAEHYLHAYQHALENLTHQQGQDVLTRDSVSIKISALYPRYEARFWPEIQQYLLPKLIHLIRFAAEADIPVTFDAEESERLELSLAIFAHIISLDEFSHYQGLGLAVQAYQKRAPAVIDWLQALATRTGKRIPVRLVKGAYWDSEIKRAQQLALSDYPVFTRKLHTDVCYLVCAHKLLKNATQFWPQFATHNAHTLAWIETVATDLKQSYEVQRLVGMGETIHDSFYRQHQRPTRLYAPIGKFNTLLPYLVRRLLENGSSQSFVNQLANTDVDAQKLCLDPVEQLTKQHISAHPKLPKPTNLFLPKISSQGFSMADVTRLATLREAFIRFHHHTWHAGCVPSHHDEVLAHNRHSPVDKHRLLGTVYHDALLDIGQAFEQAQQAFNHWQHTTVSHRAQYLRLMAKELIQHQAELLYLLTLEAGKVLEDALAEWREAVDLCFYYADEAEQLQQTQALNHITGEENTLYLAPRGVFVCISPWNFPLAIFLGQIAAAIVTGNTVIAKSASNTPLIAQRLFELFVQTGLPSHVLRLIFAPSQDIGDKLMLHPLLAGVVFTGSTKTAQHINQVLASRQGAIVPLIAETGGINAMIADSSALPEQLVQDVMQSAFNSAGQRCSALRILWLQQDIADTFLNRLEGTLATWRIGHSHHLKSDISAVIDSHSQQHLNDYCQQLQENALWHAKATLSSECSKGYYVAPHAFLVKREHLPQHEIFGPILHIATWHHDELNDVMAHINHQGYGLTLGVHSRIQSHLNTIRRQARVGNLYINRNQIGAQVGCQPFGGEALSGTGFKAGGQYYLLKFCTERVVTQNLTVIGANTELLFLD